MEKASVALCVPTYERSSIVEDFLTNCSAYYIQAGIDIYYYDSSISDKTKDLVCGWPDQDHIHYIRMPSDMHGNTKAYKIFQGFGLEKSYDFIWLSSDGYQVSKPAIERLLDNLSLEYDIVEVYGGDKSLQKETKIFTNPNEYMQKCVLDLTHFGAALLNVHTMLNGVDWSRYEKQFLAEPLIGFSHVSFYFYRALELDSFCALYLAIPKMSKNSKAKIIYSWLGVFYHTLCESWIQTIEGLPSYYTGKEQVLAYGRNILIESIDQFYRHRELGIYSMRVFLKYWAVWEKVFSFPRWKLFLIAGIPKSLLGMFYYLRRKLGQMRLQKFCTAHERIVIYGTGSRGELYDQLLDELGLTYEAFCVSRRKIPHQESHGHPVYEFGELTQRADNIGFIMAMEDRNVKEVLPVIQKVVDKGDIFCDLKFTNDILYKKIRDGKGKDRLWYPK